MKITTTSRTGAGAKASALSAVSLGVWAALASGSALGAGEQLKAEALRHASARHGVAVGDLTVTNSAEVEFANVGVKVFKAKVRTANGDVVGVNVDQYGAEVSDKQLAHYEEAAAADKRIHPDLARRISSAGAKEQLPVILWLKEPDQAGGGRPDVNEEAAMHPNARAEAVFSRADAQRAEAVERLTAPLLRNLRQLDPNAKSDRYAPVVYAKLPASAITRVAGWTEVAAVYEDVINKPELYVSRQVIRSDAVSNLGFTGYGVPVAQIEVGGRVASNPYLSVVQDATSVCSTASGHSTGVAGIIGATHRDIIGVSPGVTLRAGGSCNGVSSELQSRSTAAVDWGARVLNLSWGSNTNLVPGANDRFYDDLVFNRFRTVVKSAGNEAGPCNSGTGNVTSPGLAYNVITVGNFDHRGTTSWPDDVMQACSSWKDPTSTHGDREKPEVSAPGTNITSTTTTSPYIGNIGTGTSFAAPMITGVAALMMERNTSLQVWPEAVKAILMVSSVHNIEGAASVSEVDGAGGILADRADAVANVRGTGGSQGWDARAYDCTAPASQEVATMSLTAGIPTRLAIVWDQNPGYASYASQPSADLDLHVVNASNVVVASSSTWDNTYEIVQFTPSESGEYRLRVNKFRCDMTPRWLGFAWRAGT